MYVFFVLIWRMLLALKCFASKTKTERTKQMLDPTPRARVPIQRVLLFPRVKLQCLRGRCWSRDCRGTHTHPISNITHAAATGFSNLDLGTCYYCPSFKTVFLVCDSAALSLA